MTTFFPNETSRSILVALRKSYEANAEYDYITQLVEYPSKKREAAGSIPANVMRDFVALERFYVDGSLKAKHHTVNVTNVSSNLIRPPKFLFIRHGDREVRYLLVK